MTHEFTVTHKGTKRIVEVQLIIAAVTYNPKEEKELEEKREFLDLITKVAHDNISLIEQKVREAVEQ